MNFRISLLISTKKPAEILIGVALNLQNNCAGHSTIVLVTPQRVSHSILRTMCMHAQLCQTLFGPMACIVHQFPLSMEFSRQEYWSGLPFPTPRDLSDPGIELTSALAGRVCATVPPRKHIHILATLSLLICEHGLFCHLDLLSFLSTIVCSFQIYFILLKLNLFLSILIFLCYCKLNCFLNFIFELFFASVQKYN